MDIKFRDTNAAALKTDFLVIPVREKRLDEAALRGLDRQLKGQLRRRIERSKFTGAEGSGLLYSTAGLLPAAQILLLGLGGEAEISTDNWLRTAARARKEAAGIGAEDIAVLMTSGKDAESAAGAIAEGVLLASYQFNKYRSNSKSNAELKALTLFAPGLKRSAALEHSAERAQTIASAVFLARDLINEPPSVTTARFLGEQAERHCRGRGLSVEVWGRRKIEAMKLAGLLAVNRGSHEETRLIGIR